GLERGSGLGRGLLAGALLLGAACARALRRTRLRLLPLVRRGHAHALARARGPAKRAAACLSPSRARLSGEVALCLACGLGRLMTSSRYESPARILLSFGPAAKGPS